MFLTDSLVCCRSQKGMELFSFFFMPSHVHLIFRDKQSNPGKLLKELKSYTSKVLQTLIEDHNQESKREWLLWMMERAGKKNSILKKRQFWQQHNEPIELWSNRGMDQN